MERDPTKSKNKLLIIHYGEFEKYPPVINLCRYLIKEQLNFSIHTRSCHRHDKHVIITKPRKKNILSFFNFQFKTIFIILKKRPSHVLYYDSLSCIGVFTSLFFLKFFKKETVLIAHHHEYDFFNDRINNSFTGALSFYFERKLFKKIDFFSQTNIHRIKLFENDLQKNGLDIPKSFFIWPNYPPDFWFNNNQFSKKQNLILFIGTIGTESFYIDELIDFIRNNQEYTFHFYLSNFDKLNFLDFPLTKFENCRFFKSVKYDELQLIIPKYDIGLILYKPNHPNLIYNETNKLYEYLIFGLDVIVPIKMYSIKELCQKNKLIEEKVFFFEKNLDEIQIDRLGFNKKKLFSEQNQLFNQIMSRIGFTETSKINLQKERIY